MTDNATAGAVPDGLLAVLAGRPPETLFELALRWVPADTATAYRIAALACAMMRAPLNLTARRPGNEAAGRITTGLHRWLASERGNVTAEQATLRIFALYFAVTETAGPDTAQMTPERHLDQVTAAANVLLDWFGAGNLKRGLLS